MMNDRCICLIVAVSQNGVIGRDNDLPWKLRSDLQRFKRLTMGHTILMGRKTFESLPKVLPGRKSIVLSRDENFRVAHPDVTIARDVGSALSQISAEELVFVIGGANIFAQLIPLATDLMLTRVLKRIEGDTYLPPFDLADWQLIASEDLTADEFNEYATRFEHWRRDSSDDR
jgi:dihydrofolate reductase